MIRRIIQIDEEKCNGCGACAQACHEGAIEIVDGKAKLTREDSCDGLGDCLPNCPTGAITFTERDAPAYDEAAVLASKRKKQNACDAHRSEAKDPEGNDLVSRGCPGERIRQLRQAEEKYPVGPSAKAVSCLAQWPCQIRLVPVNAPYFDGAKLLVAADCTAYAYAGIHEEFMRGKVTLIGCPKLDDTDYSEKLTEILKRNEIRSVTVLRMEVPCCGGLERAVTTALKNSGKLIPWQVVTVSVDGTLFD